ncbi:site-specific DNA-methyltransferase [Candidatus Shapirobacteria bacterium]|nr:site-specific DNA-methyltransferase [Candidatus Shapirobacteria bacterium]
MKKKKKYGLVWEEKPEEVAEMCKEKLPVLKEVENKEIITDKNKPVNLLIEGDNYHALSVLNYTHAKKVDVIYIDPPYNTGNKDFIFNDSYVDKEDSYRHSKWLSFMEKRLKLAKNLLKDTGVIFISIDDNEVAQLKMLMDNPDLFGEKNFLVTIKWRRKITGGGSNIFNPKTEYLLVYAKNKSHFSINKEPTNPEAYSNPDNDPRGPWQSVTIKASVTQAGDRKPYTIKTPTGKKITGQWLYTKENFEKLLKDNRIIFPNKGNGIPRKKQFLYEVKGITPDDLWLDAGTTGSATRMIQGMFGKKVFDTIKPVALITRILKISARKRSIILDFMAGSGTTGHAVLELNKEDGGNRQFILCTNNENNICSDVCYPRIKKVIEGYENLKGKLVEGLGGNLKYFKTDFVDYDEPTDRNKIKLTKQATEMLCVKEGTFEKVIDNEKFKIFKNSSHYTGIIWDQTAIPAFKKAIKDINGEFSVYIFSLSDEAFDDEFKDVKQRIELSPIPEAILRVYRRIFK